MPGFDKSKFKNLTKNESEQLMCGICLEILRNPYITKCCGQAYCRDCIEECINKVKTCPNDRKPLTWIELCPPPLLVKNMLNSLEIYCQYNNNGCNEVKIVEFIESHENECKFNPEATCCDCMAINGISSEHNCIENLKIKLIDMKQKYDNIEKEFNLLKIEAAEEITNLNKQLETTEMELFIKINSEEIMQTLIKKLKSEILESQNENDKLNISIKQTNYICENLKNQIEKLESDLVNGQEDNANLARDYKKSNMSFEKLNINYSKCLKSTEALKNDNDKLKEELKIYANITIVSKEGFDVLLKNLSEKNNHEIIVIQVKKLEDKILEREIENNSLKSTIYKLSNSIINLEMNCSIRDSEMIRLTQENESLRAESVSHFLTAMVTLKNDCEQ